VDILLKGKLFTFGTLSDTFHVEKKNQD